MTLGLFATRLRQAGTLAVVAALIAATPVAATTLDTSTTTPTITTPPVSTPAPTPTVPKPGTPTVAKPKPKTSAKTIRRTPPTKSAIDVGVDRKTAAFRQALADKQKRLDEFTAQLDALDAELEIASQQYNAASDQLSQMKNQVQVAQGDLTNARTSYDLQTNILGQRAASMYKDGSFGAFEVLLDSKSVADFVARVKFLNTIGLADADIAASLQAQKELVEQQILGLKNTETLAESLEFELKARQIEVMLRIQERQQMLSATQTDLLAMLDKEASRRQSTEAQLLASVLSGAGKAGIIATPGSPVETALAYHGIPYLWGGSTPRAFDCSGLVLYVFAQHGVKLPHYSGSQFLMGEKIAPAALLPGDVVFFGSPVHHVGIYIGGGYFIHSPRTGDFVKISLLSGRSDYAGARRYAYTTRTAAISGGSSSAAAALRTVR